MCDPATQSVCDPATQSHATALLHECRGFASRQEPGPSLGPFQPPSCCKRRFLSEPCNTNLPRSSLSRLKGAEVLEYEAVESAPCGPTLARRRSPGQRGTSPWFSSEPGSSLRLRWREAEVSHRSHLLLIFSLFSKYASVVRTFRLIFLLELLDSQLHSYLVALSLKQKFAMSSTCFPEQCFHCGPLRWLPGAASSQRRRASSPAPELSGFQTETSSSAGRARRPAAPTPD